jgi:cellulose synthase (UDP-forming)
VRAIDNNSCLRSDEAAVRRTERPLQVVAAVALAWGAAYLVWRIGWTGGLANPYLFTTLLAAEIAGWVNLAFFTFLAWSAPGPAHEQPRPLQAGQRSPDATRPARTVDVLVPTYDEPVEVLRATLLGCRAMTHPHTTWLLDDGRRPEMEALAGELGARYLTRPDNEHAKAGNINHALGHLEGELVAVLDADHVPLPHFLDALVPYFDDAHVVLVQAPHEFYNLDSIQHIAEDRHEQSLFFRVICPGKDRHNAAFWCGSGTVIRRAPLLDIGGVRTETIAEDFHTTIVLHSRGWTTRYHDETLLLGLAPHDLGSFLLQRSRWARGNLRVFLTRQNPLWASGLRPAQRLSYFASLSHYFAGPQRLALLSVLCLTLLTGQLPLHGEALVFATLWAPWVLLSLCSTRLLGRGISGPVAATRHGWMTMGAYTVATLSLLVPVTGRFKVTPKTGTDGGGLGVLLHVKLLTACTAALLVAALARLGQVVGLVPLPPMPLVAQLGTLVIAGVELAIISKLLASLVERRQRRQSFRFPVDVVARVGSEVHRVVDLNHHGAGVVVPGPVPLGDALEMSLRLPALGGGTNSVDLRGVVRSAAPAGGGLAGWRLGVEFVDPSATQVDQLLEYCHVLRPAAASAGRSTRGSDVEPSTLAVRRSSPAPRRIETASLPSSDEAVPPAAS